MNVESMMTDLESILAEDPRRQSYDLGCARYVGDGSDRINMFSVAAFDIDDNELSLWPGGEALSLIGLKPNVSNAGEFLTALKKLPSEQHVFEACARSSVKRLVDGSVASIGQQTWGTGVHEDEGIVYFYYGDSPE